MEMQVLNGGRDVTGGYKVDVSRGERVGRVSSEWFNRPDDERFLCLDDLYASVKGRAERSHTRIVESAAIRVEAHRRTLSDWVWSCRAQTCSLPRHTGASANSPASSAPRRPICGNCLRRSRASISNTD